MSQERNTDKLVSVAVIGAGLCGVTVAKHLQENASQPLAVTVFEKSRSVGGRMSTRRAEAYHFDHGAQYFTVHSDAFQSALRDPIAKNIVQPWLGRHVSITGAEQGNGASVTPVNAMRYVAVPAMNSLAKYWAQGVRVVTQTRIQQLEAVCEDQAQTRWCLRDEQGQAHGPFDWVVITTPCQQALPLLPPSFASAHQQALSKMPLAPCVSVMLGFSESLGCGFDSAEVSGSDIAWVANTASKPERPPGDSLVIHASERWSEAHLDDSDEAILAHLISQASQLTQQNCAQASYQAVHRWRYAKASTQADTPVYVDEQIQVAVAGDWCRGGRVEYAYLSGLATAQTILCVLNV